MTTELFREYALMVTPIELAEQPNLVRKGTVIQDVTTGQIRGHMQELFRSQLPSLQGITAAASALNLGISIASFAYMQNQFQALNRRLNQIEAKIDIIDQKLDVLIGMVQQIDRKVEAVGNTLISLAGRIDARHRDTVFAEIGSVLDTLAYADRKSRADAQLLIANNITPTRKAVRLFGSLVDEFDQGLATYDVGRVETIRMRVLVGLLAIKLDMAMGETEAARERGLALLEETNTRSAQLLNAWLEKWPLANWSEGADEIASIALSMEQIDGLSALKRVSAAVTFEHNLLSNLSEALPKKVTGKSLTDLYIEASGKTFMALASGPNTEEASKIFNRLTSKARQEVENVFEGMTPHASLCANDPCHKLPGWS